MGATGWIHRHLLKIDIEKQQESSGNLKMKTLKDKFIISNKIISEWKLKCLSGRSTNSFWKLRYYLFFATAFIAVGILFLPVAITLTSLISLAIFDYLVYRIDRRKKLSHELQLLDSFLMQKLKTEFYEKNTSSKYERHDISHFGTRMVSQVNPIHYIHKLVVESLCKEKTFQGDRLLDIGCHYGIITESFRGSWSKIIGTDLQQYTMTEFKKRMNSTPVLANAEYLPFKQDRIDGVSFMEVIEHLTDPFSILREIHRMLKPKGKILLTTNNRHEIHWEFFLNPLKLFEKAVGLFSDAVLPIRPIMWYGHDDKLFYYHTAFSKSEITEILQSCGFHIEYISSFAYAYHFYQLFLKFGLDFTERSWARYQFITGNILGKIPIIKYLGAHWLIVAIKK